MLALGAPRLVYVSCNPKTGARDVRDFLEGGYRLRSIEPIDSFRIRPRGGGLCAHAPRFTMTTYVEPGTLLLSAPDLQDPNFMHTVVLMLDHGATGALGLVVNRALEQTVASVFPDHERLSDVHLALRQGGPWALMDCRSCTAGCQLPGPARPAPVSPWRRRCTWRRS